ncbi:MAG TPA: pilus assembly protein TadG-related protein [Pirellulales bacterium]|nr:pilus assembly protein TadG-related protein [Pirellulales bacterium]
MNRQPQTSRSGKVFVFVAISVPALFGVVGLVFDTGLIMADKENLQHAADAAATAAAMDLLENKTNAAATATAASYLQTLNGFSDAQVTTNIPPASGPYAGRSGFVEVIATRQHSNVIIQIVGAALQMPITARAVAGFSASTVGSAVVVLDPTPNALSIDSSSLSLPALPSYPALIGGLNVPGLGAVEVNGAVLVNTTWGGVDQNGKAAGTGSGPPWGIACTSALPLTQLKAVDIRVVGGVDDQSNYASYTQGQTSPLRANALSVQDPFDQLPAPCLASDPVNVSTTDYGGVQVVQLPLLPPKVFNPGVYDWIEIDLGNVVFNPGIYIIRSINPATQIALNMLGGTVTANGVLFYITNSTSYDAATGAPDSGDGDTRPADPGMSAMAPSVVINAALPGTSFSPLATGSSPFGGMLIYQRRQDYRPIIVVYQSLLGSAAFQGAVYAKWGHFLFAGDGTLNMSIVAGTARLVPVLGLTIQPTSLLAPAYDVYLFE